MPVALGWALAVHDGCAHTLVGVLCALGAMGMQIGCNLFNDFADAKSGVDDAERLGPVRVVHTGAIEADTVKRAAFVAFALACLCGLGLLPFGGVRILCVGVLSVVAGLAYTGGPCPLGYVGLGEVFSFLFFGVVATTATYALQAQHITTLSVMVSVSMGCFASAILLINNLRDRVGDARAGKKTLSVRLGAQFSRILYAALLVSALACVALSGLAMARPLVWPPLCVAPWAGILVQQTWRKDGRRLNPVLVSTARLQAVFGALLVVSLLW